MSNATETARKSGGEPRRRRSRGGKNRNRNQNTQSRSQDGQNRTGRPRSKGAPRRARKPVKLTLWQKLLKAIGLYKEPKSTREGREGREGRDKGTKAGTGAAPKSNIRNARSKDAEAPEQSRDSKPERKRSKRGGDPSTVQSSRVYIGNLSYDVTEQDLKELFKGVGTVRNVEIVYNRSTHRSKGYGFVEMIHRDDAVRCVEVLHDQPFMGRELIVSGAKSKEEGDERDDQEPHTEIKAADVELAPLPQANEQAAVSAKAEETPAAEAEVSPAEPAEPIAVAETAETAETEDQEEAKQG